VSKLLEIVSKISIIRLPISHTRLTKLRDDLVRAGIRVPVELYYSFVITLSLILEILGIIYFIATTYPIIDVFLILLSRGLIFNYTMLCIRFFTGIIALFIGPLVYVVLINLPKVLASNIKYYIDQELLFFVSFLYMTSVANISLNRLVDFVLKSRLFNAIKGLIKRVYIHTVIGGHDVLSALRKVAHESASTDFREVIEGYFTAISIGADLASYLSTKLKELVSRLSETLKRNTEFMQTIMQSAMGAIPILEIFASIFFIVQAVSPTGAAIVSSENAITMNLVIGLALLPFFSIIFLILGDKAYKIPSTTMKHHISAAISALAAVTMSLIILAVVYNGDPLSARYIPLISSLLEKLNAKMVEIPYALVLGIILTVTFLPAAIYGKLFVKEKTGIQEETAEFTREFAEAIKSGLTPEKAFTELSKSPRFNYLKKYLRGIALSLKLGQSITEQYKIIEKMKDYISRMIMTLLLEGLDIGGARYDMLDYIASFSRSLVESIKGMRASLKVLTYIPYIVALLAVFASVVTTYLIDALVGTLTTFSTSFIERLACSVYLTLVVNNFLLGLVAGKIGTGELASGYMHACILTLITVLSLIVLTAFPVISITLPKFG